MKKLPLLLLVLPFFIQLINSHQLSTNIISQTVRNVPDIEIITINKNQNYEPTLEELYKNITFTPSGLTCYFKHIYNCPKYAQEALPAIPFKHLEEFLNHGIKTNQSRNYTSAVFRLFDKKFKSIPYLNSEELVPFLQKLPALLEKDLESDQKRKSLIKKIIRFELENNFEKLKRNPDLFIDNLAEKIIENDFTSENEISREHFCFTIMKFIETCLNKTIWSPVDNDIWENFMNTGKELTNLKEVGIIRDNDDLDDCQWTLTTRFCFFLSLSGTALSVDFYEDACKELSKGIKHLDEITEQEELIISKSASIKDAVILNYASLENESLEYYKNKLNS